MKFYNPTIEGLYPENVKANGDFETVLLPEKSYQHQFFLFNFEPFQCFYSFTQHCMLQPANDLFLFLFFRQHDRLSKVMSAFAYKEKVPLHI